MDIAPKSAVAQDVADLASGRVLAFGRSIGIAIDLRGLVHVYDIIGRKELAQIQPSAKDLTQGAHLFETEGIVVLESIDRYCGRNLQAYSFK